MSKFFSFSLAAFLILVTLSVGFLVWRGKNESVAIILQAGDKKELEKPIIKSQPFFVSGWLPYWTKISGAAEFEKNISAFNEIHPFAFGVNVDGSLKDTLKIKEAPWSDLIVLAGKNKVAIVPTILWGDAAAMHNVFSNKNISDKHINAITAMLEKNNLSGVDIDYEGKDVTDRDLFSIFLKALHEKLTSSGKTLNCTIEARTQDDPPAGWSGTKAMAFANDYQVLNNFCDSVTVMAYDQAFQENGTKKTFENYDTDPHAPNANSQWTEKVIQYALRYIAPEKIILGVPTYGWEFTFAKTSNGYIYTRYQSVSYPKALAEAQAAGVNPTRDNGGEPSFVYKSSSEQHIVTFSDAEAVRQKIDLAKEYTLKGVSLFKIDGLTDPEIFKML